MELILKPYEDFMWEHRVHTFEDFSVLICSIPTGWIPYYHVVTFNFITIRDILLIPTTWSLIYRDVATGLIAIRKFLTLNAMRWLTLSRLMFIVHCTFLQSLYSHFRSQCSCFIFPAYLKAP